MVETKEVEDSGIEVADMDGFGWVADVPAVVVCGAVSTRFDAATCHPDGEGATVVITPCHATINVSL